MCESESVIVGRFTFEMEGSKRYRKFVFTLNNYTAQDEADLKASAQEGKLKWIIYGHEECPSTGTPHLQGALYTDREHSFKSLHKIKGLGNAHFQAMRATIEQNVSYCTKDAKNIVEIGKRPRQGARTDLLPMTEEITVKKRKATAVLNEYPVECIKYHRGIERLFRAVNDVPSTSPYHKPQVFYFWGPTASGKSRTAREYFAEQKMDYWVKNPESGQWWDGYEYEPGVIMEEFRGGQVKFSTLLTWLDGYPYQVQVKHGMMQVQPRVIILTSDRPLEEQYKVEPGRFNQLTRRITEQRCFDVIPHIETPSGTVNLS